MGQSHTPALLRAVLAAETPEGTWMGLREHCRTPGTCRRPGIRTRLWELTIGDFALELIDALARRHSLLEEWSTKK